MDDRAPALFYIGKGPTARRVLTVTRNGGPVPRNVSPLQHARSSAQYLRVAESFGSVDRDAPDVPLAEALAQSRAGRVHVYRFDPQKHHGFYYDPLARLWRPLGKMVGRHPSEQHPESLPFAASPPPADGPLAGPTQGDASNLPSPGVAAGLVLGGVLALVVIDRLTTVTPPST